MRLCMFTPVASELERGWPGRLEADRVVQLAAQTLQSFFSGGSSAREHATFRLDEIVLRAPVLEPPSVRLFDDEARFAFANPAAVRSPGALILRPHGRLDALVRIASVIGADGEVGGWTGLVEWRAPELPEPKDRDFALLLGPLVDTELADGFDWDAAREHASRHTRLRPGDLLGGPVRHVYEHVAEGPITVVFDGLGELSAFVA